MVGISVTFISSGCNSYKSTRLEADGNQMVQQIEAYRQREKRLPDSVNEIGIEEKLDGPLYYKKLDNDRYLIWFGTQFGESRTYDSREKQWRWASTTDQRKSVTPLPGWTEVYGKFLISNLRLVEIRIEICAMPISRNQFTLDNDLNQ